MANFATPFNTDAELGGIGSVFTPSTLDGYDNPPIAKGTVRLGTDNSEWLYVQAATVINQGDCVHIDQNSNASQMTNALATGALGDVGFCQAAGGIPSGSYGWVAIFGNALNINVATGTAAGAALYTAATAGVLSSTAASQVQIYGVKTLTANSSGVTAMEPAIAVAPRTTN